MGIDQISIILTKTEKLKIMWKNLWLILASIGFIVVLGAAIYEHVNVVPRMSAAPPMSLSMFSGQYGLETSSFWIPVHPINLVFFIIALIANWKTERKQRILTVFLSYVGILLITGIYFVPTLLSIINTPYQLMVDEALRSKVVLWERLSLVRMCFIFILAAMLLSSLSLSNEKKNA